MATDSHRLLFSSQPVARISNRLCFCVDLGQIATPTRFWNPLGAAGESLEIIGQPTFDFARPRLRKLAAALAPAYLRIGGTEADRAYYAVDDAEEPPTTPPPPFTSVLHSWHLNAIGEFTRSTGFEVIFTLNAGWGARSAQGTWESGQMRKLLQYVRRRSIPFAVLELGNEPNAWPYLQKGLAVTPERYAIDLFALARARDDELPRALIAAPATAFFPAIGEVPTLATKGWGWPSLVSFGNYQRRVLKASEQLALPDILTWHYYPGQSDRAVGLSKWRIVAIASLLAAAIVDLSQRRAARQAARQVPRAARGGCSSCARPFVFALAIGAVAVCAALHAVVTPVTLASLRSPAVLDRARVWGDAVSRSAREVEPASRRPAVWLGETGSAQAGGQPGVSGRWSAALWWLDQLGSLSTLGHEVQCRQTLSGSDYGLLHEGSLEPTPEYWVSLLWRRLMGTAVLAASAEGGGELLRVYCHAAAKGGAARAPTCLAINLADVPVRLELPAPRTARALEVWLLEGVGGQLNATDLRVNGVTPKALADGTVPSLPGAKRGAALLDGGGLVVPAIAAAFVRMG